MGHGDMVAIRRIIFLAIIMVMDDMLYVFSLRVMISISLKESISCLDFKVYVTRGF